MLFVGLTSFVVGGLLGYAMRAEVSAEIAVLVKAAKDELAAAEKKL